MTSGATLPKAIANKYEYLNVRHAIEILSTGCKAEYDELLDMLEHFSFKISDITKGGGNESEVPKNATKLLRPKGWHETHISGDLVVTVRTHDTGAITERKETIEKFIDGHKVDYVKGRVAFDLEWNSKDQTFDRDLYAVRAFYDANIISAAVLLTRAESMDAVFKKLGPAVKAKYGATTTHMSKLLYRLRAGRNGGCPVLALGITPKVIEDWKP